MHFVIISYDVYVEIPVGAKAYGAVPNSLWADSVPHRRALFKLAAVWATTPTHMTRLTRTPDMSFLLSHPQWIGIDNPQREGERERERDPIGRSGVGGSSRTRR